MKSLSLPFQYCIEMNDKSAAKKSKLIGYLKIIALAFFLICAFLGYKAYQMILQPNVLNEGIITIDEDASFDSVLDSLRAQQIIKNESYFVLISKYKSYPQRIKSGKYAFSAGQSSNAMVNMLLAGNQLATTVTFNNLRFIEQLAGKLSKDLQADSLEFIEYFNRPEVWKEYGFNQHSFRAMFIPNTYQIYWTCSVEQFTKRMHKEYQRFWNEDRMMKAKALNLSPVEVITLASIVQEETIKSDEKPMVAGLYLNRLKRGMLLQADPTLKYAAGDFSIRRVLNKHKELNSPYNTYKHSGLPPGPINFPEITSIDAVLNPTTHNYIYMCAKEDFSGYHNFARTLSQHNANARNYHRELNKLKIYQ